MRLGLLHRHEYPEPIRLELEQLTAAISTSYDREHDADGRQRVIWARWNGGEAQSIANASVVAVLCRLPDPKNVGDLAVDPVGGTVRVLTPGVYSVVGQVRFATNGTGVRAAMLLQNGIRQAHMQVAATGGGIDTQVQVSALMRCAVNDTVALVAVQTSGGALNTTALSSGLHETYLTIARVA